MKRHRKRRVSRSTILFIPVSALIIVFLVVYGVGVFMKVLEINIVGASIYQKDDIINASGIAKGDDLLFLNLDAASRNIKSEMPFVRDVTIKRLLPSVILIEIKETTAIATIEYQDSVLIIDSDCKILKTEENAPDGLIEVVGLSFIDQVEGSVLKAELGSDKQLQYLKDVLSAIETEGIEKDISYLDVSNTSKISIGYLGQFKVVLGPPSNVKHKLSQLPGLIAEIKTKNSDKVTGEIDMSDSSGKWIFNSKD